MFDKIKQLAYLRILDDLSDIIEGWDWEEDIYKCGKITPQERKEWAKDRIEEMIEHFEMLEA